MRCPDCRMENPDSAVLCQYCGYRWVVQRQAPQVRRYRGFVDTEFKAILAVLLGALVASGCLLAYVYVYEVPVLRVTNVETSFTAEVNVLFTVEVRNLGGGTGHATIDCLVMFASDDSTYEGSQDITLGALETRVYEVEVFIPFFYPGETFQWEVHLE